MSSIGAAAAARGWTNAALARAALAVALAVYLSAYLRDTRTFLLLDHVDLAIHEAGHVIFAPFGEFIGMAGGTLLQLIVPVAFVLYFFRRRDRYAAAIVVFWVSQSLFNVATYAGDARAQLLPLVGGEDVLHDWAYMLGSLGWLHHDTTIEGSLRAVAFLLWAGALVVTLRHSRVPPPARLQA
jgi:hypothetical protein